MLYRAKKTWNGFVSVRSDRIQKAVDLREDLIIEFEGERMTVPLRRLMNPFKFHSKVMKSQFGGYYKLYDFKWLPINKNQIALL